MTMIQMEKKFRKIIEHFKTQDLGNKKSDQIGDPLKT